MTAAVIRIDAEAYEAACTVVGQGVGLAVESAATSLLDALATSGAMAGSDAAGRAWAEGYDRSADEVFDVVKNVITASFRLAALLEQTGFNYGRAEMASVPGGTVASSADTTSYAQWSCVLGAPPSAAGASSSIGAPPGWSLVEHAVGYLWPNGHQDRLRAAGSAWAAFADCVGATADYVPRASACLADQDAPETGDAETACRTLSDQLRELATGCTAMADSCAAFAGHLDEAHSAVEHELVSLLEWTAAIEGAGGLFAVVTFGGSEAAAQAAEASRIAAAAVRIAAILERLGTLARAAAETVANAAYRVAGISDALRPLLTSRIVVALADGAEPLRIAQTAANAAKERLGAAAAARTRLAGIDDPRTFNPQVLRGMSFEDVRAALSGQWPEGASRSGNGWVFTDPTRNGRQVRIMPGYGTGVRPDPITHGPYAVFSQNGDTVKIPLAGNPMGS